MDKENEIPTNKLSRRTFVTSAALGATVLSVGGVLSACTSSSNNGADASADLDAASSGASGEGTVLRPTSIPDAKTASNFDVVPESVTIVGTTIENLMTAITGETGATTKYEAYASVAKKEGFDDLARLFTATADAEKIHIELEYALAVKLDPNATKPSPPTVQTHQSDINLIFGAQGEIYETSDMYPSFIKAAQAAGDDDAVVVFTRAKLAESYHAQLYLDAYNTIDTPTGETYYLCPICGYLHKGENFTNCPICLTPADAFTAY